MTNLDQMPSIKEEETKEQKQEKIAYIAKTTSHIKLAEMVHTARLNAKWIKKQGAKEERERIVNKIFDMIEEGELVLTIKFDEFKENLEEKK
jgi:hypothetical protein